MNTTDAKTLLVNALRDPDIKCVLLSGPQGVGKTQMLREVAESANATLRCMDNGTWRLGNLRVRETDGSVPIATVFYDLVIEIGQDNGCVRDASHATSDMAYGK